jgi:hypothetical protein
VNFADNGRSRQAVAEEVGDLLPALAGLPKLSKLFAAFGGPFEIDAPAAEYFGSGHGLIPLE